MGTKLATSSENPVDVIILKFTKLLLPLARQTGHTANVITMYSFLFGLLATVALYTGNPLLFVVLLVTSYTFDCMDGQFARTYNETSTLGDVLDHATDAIVLLLVFGIVGVKYRAYVNRPVVAYFVALSLACFFYTANQQWYYTRDAQNRGSSQGPELLDVLLPVAEHTHSYKAHRILRWFGPGTWWIFCLIPVVAYIVVRASPPRAKTC